MKRILQVLAAVFLLPACAVDYGAYSASRYSSSYHSSNCPGGYYRTPGGGCRSFAADERNYRQRPYYYGSGYPQSYGRPADGKWRDRDDSRDRYGNGHYGGDRYGNNDRGRGNQYGGGDNRGQQNRASQDQGSYREVSRRVERRGGGDSRRVVRRQGRR